MLLIWKHKCMNKKSTVNIMKLHYKKKTKYYKIKKINRNHNKTDKKHDYNEVYQSPSDSHTLGGTVAGDDGDETRVMRVLRNTRNCCQNKLQSMITPAQTQKFTLYDVKTGNFGPCDCDLQDQIIIVREVFPVTTMISRNSNAVREHIQSREQLCVFSSNTGC